MKLLILFRLTLATSFQPFALADELNSDEKRWIDKQFGFFITQQQERAPVSLSLHLWTFQEESFAVWRNFHLSRPFLPAYMRVLISSINSRESGWRLSGPRLSFLLSSTHTRFVSRKGDEGWRHTIYSMTIILIRPQFMLCSHFTPMMLCDVRQIKCVTRLA